MKPLLTTMIKPIICIYLYLQEFSISFLSYTIYLLGVLDANLPYNNFYKFLLFVVLI